jgi:spore coat polysaccharide biosynthesis predicted glycosyltransferase SpsG
VKRLLIRLDANQDIGFGHAVRCARLLRMLRTPVRPIVMGDGKEIANQFGDAEIVPFDGGHADEWVRVMKAADPHAIMVDLPLRTERPWSAIRSVGVPVVAIDDEGGAVDADLVINGTVVEEFHRYEGLPPSCRLLIGPQFTLIDAAFATHRWSPLGCRSIVVVIGSGERAREWTFLLARDGLRRVGANSVTMVVGSGFTESGTLRLLLKQAGFNLRQGLTAEELAYEFAHSAAALTTGGMVVYEALAVGVPLVAFPQLENLKSEMAWFATRGCLTDLGYDGGMDMARVAAALSRLLDDRAAAAASSQAGRSIIDARGMSRAAQAIDEFLYSA